MRIQLTAGGHIHCCLLQSIHHLWSSTYTVTLKPIHPSKGSRLVFDNTTSLVPKMLVLAALYGTIKVVYIPHLPVHQWVELLRLITISPSIYIVATKLRAWNWSTLEEASSCYSIQTENGKQRKSLSWMPDGGKLVSVLLTKLQYSGFG